MKPNIAIAEKNLNEVSLLLNNVLADEYVLYTKTRKAHWNIQGPNFMELHKFFEGQYETIDVSIDDIAERVRSLGHFPIASLKEFLELTRLSEKEGDFSAQNKILQALLDDHETVIQLLRKDIVTTSDTHKDLGTADFLTGLMEQHEKMAWMIRSYLS